MESVSSAKLISTTGTDKDPAYKGNTWDIRYSSVSDVGSGEWRFEQDVDCAGFIFCGGDDIWPVWNAGKWVIASGARAMVGANAVGLLPISEMAYTRQGLNNSASLSIGLGSKGISGGSVGLPTIAFDSFNQLFVLEHFTGISQIRDREGHAAGTQISFQKLFQLATDARVEQQVSGEWEIRASSFAYMGVTTTPQLVFRPAF